LRSLKTKASDEEPSNLPIAGADSPLLAAPTPVNRSPAALAAKSKCCGCGGICTRRFSPPPPSFTSCAPPIAVVGGSSSADDPEEMSPIVGCRTKRICRRDAPKGRSFDRPYRRGKAIHQMFRERKVATAHFEAAADCKHQFAQNPNEKLTSMQPLMRLQVTGLGVDFVAICK
jgi:hypothetical protein